VSHLISSVEPLLPFSSRDQNPVPDLVEVKARVVPCEGDDNRFKLLFELRIHPSQLEEQIGTVEVELFEATLSLYLYGMQTVSKSKLGQPTVPPVVTRAIQVEETVSKTLDSEAAREFTGAGSVVDSNRSPVRSHGGQKVGYEGNVFPRFCCEENFY
jgi:hypothetical protein